MYWKKFLFLARQGARRLFWRPRLFFLTVLWQIYRGLVIQLTMALYKVQEIFGPCSFAIDAIFDVIVFRDLHKSVSNRKLDYFRTRTILMINWLISRE